MIARGTRAARTMRHPWASPPIRLQHLRLPPDTPDRPHIVRLSSLMQDTSCQKPGFGYSLKKRVSGNLETSFRGAGASREPGNHEYRPAKTLEKQVFIGSGPGPAGRPGTTASCLDQFPDSLGKQEPRGFPWPEQGAAIEIRGSRLRGTTNKRRRVAGRISGQRLPTGAQGQAN